MRIDRHSYRSYALWEMNEEVWVRVRVRQTNESPFRLISFPLFALWTELKPTWGHYTHRVREKRSFNGTATPWFEYQCVRFSFRPCLFALGFVFTVVRKSGFGDTKGTHGKKETLIVTGINWTWFRISVSFDYSIIRVWLWKNYPEWIHSPVGVRMRSMLMTEKNGCFVRNSLGKAPAGVRLFVHIRCVDSWRKRVKLTHLIVTCLSKYPVERGKSKAGSQVCRRNYWAGRRKPS